ncbi:MAG: FkbM family methyltransferase [Acidobacteria bacterium]|nr:FkbM family methyltransferase [Acidobacteriota bacterium]
MSVLGKLRNQLYSRLESRHTPVDVTHAQALRWFQRRDAEYQKLAAAVAPHVDRDGTIFDIGANIGYFSLLLTRKVGFRGKVFLFEPVPNLAGLCRQTFAGTSEHETEVCPYGLSDEDGEVELFVAANGNIGWNTLISESATGDMERLNITVRAFDSCGISVRPSFMKIDVEGAEYKVLGGMKEALGNWNPRPVILCEIGWGRNHPDWDAELAVFSSLQDLGYRFTRIDGSEARIADLNRTTDIICLPDGVAGQRPFNSR